MRVGDNPNVSPWMVVAIFATSIGLWLAIFRLFGWIG